MQILSARHWRYPRSLGPEWSGVQNSFYLFPSLPVTGQLVNVQHQTAHRLLDYQFKAEYERVSILVHRLSFPLFPFLSSRSVLSYNIKPTQHSSRPTVAVRLSLLLV